MTRRAARAMILEARRMVLDNPSLVGVVVLAVTYPVAAFLAPQERRPCTH